MFYVGKFYGYFVKQQKKNEQGKIHPTPYFESVVFVRGRIEFESRRAFTELPDGFFPVTPHPFGGSTSWCN